MNTNVFVKKDPLFSANTNVFVKKEPCLVLIQMFSRFFASLMWKNKNITLEPGRSFVFFLRITLFCTSELKNSSLC